MNRKELVQALEAKWGVKANYLGVPSCAYEIHCGEGTFQVDRHGVIRNAEGQELATEELLTQTQIEPLGSLEPEEQNGLQIDGCAVELPLAGHTVTSLRNLVNMLASKQQLLVTAFGLTQPLLDGYFAKELDKIPIEDMDTFPIVWAELGDQRCQSLELDFEKQRVILNLPKENPLPEEMAAFQDLVVCMNENAKTLKHSSFKPAQEENPKYALRTWLLRLGMHGDRFKNTRKVLLARLSGSSAFRHNKPETSPNGEGA